MLQQWFRKEHEPKLVEMLIAQRKLEETLSDSKDWYKDKQPQSYAFAILAELVEFNDHIGWKWWVNQECDLQQAKFELVDVMHFTLASYLNFALQTAYVDGEDAEEYLSEQSSIVIEGFYEAASGYFEQIETNREVPILDELLFMMSKVAENGGVNLGSYIHLCENVNMSFDELHRLFMAKYILNLFRYRHGYSTGSYYKMWAGQEDNIYLWNFSAKGLHGQDLYDALLNSYGKLVLNKESKGIKQILSEEEGKMLELLAEAKPNPQGLITIAYGTPMFDGDVKKTLHSLASKNLVTLAQHTTRTDALLVRLHRFNN